MRATTLRTATATIPNHEVITVKNSSKGIMRYVEVAWRVLFVRITKRPDAYLLTFRGYEMVLPVRILTLGRPLVFDEFINLEEWLIENKKMVDGSFTQKTIGFFYRGLMRLPNLLITDTLSHAKYSAKRSGLRADKIVPVPVATDEDIFKPIEKSSSISGSGAALKVFYYGGKMLPLHGISYVLEASLRLSNDPVEFVIIGGTAETETQIEEYRSQGANIKYIHRVPYEELAARARQADVCLGGPFGGTLQSQFVITGKTYQFMALQKPVIIGRNKETERKIFKDKGNCLIVNQADTNDLVAAIRWCIGNPEKLEAIGESARATYERDLSIEAVSRTLSTEVFSRLVEQ